ncbi:MAG: hypothetical protein ACM3SM_15755 [Bacteroidota bacterium]
MLRCAIIFTLILIQSSAAQFTPGARQLSLSCSDAATGTDIFSFVSNPAATSQISSPGAGVFYLPSPFGMKELAQISFAASYSFAPFSAAAGFMHYGYELYTKNIISVSISAQPEEQFSAGITLNYHHLSVKNYNSTGSITVDAGILYSISEALSSGFSIRNLTRASIGKQSDQLPVILTAGISYTPQRIAEISFSLEKELESGADISAGIELFPVDFFVIRCGVASYPQSYSGGIGVLYGLLEFSYGVFSHSDLGLTHFIGIIISASSVKETKSAVTF